MQSMTFWNQLLSLCIMPLRSIQVVVCTHRPFVPAYCWVVFHRVEAPSCASPTKGHRSGFPLQLLQIRLPWSSTYGFLRTHKFSSPWKKCSGVPLLDYMVNVCFVVYSLKKLPKYLPECVSFYLFTNNVWKTQFLHSLTSIWYCHYFFLNFSSSNRCVISYHDLNWHLIMANDAEHLFDVFICLLHLSSGKMSIRVLCPFLNGIAFQRIEFLRALYMF